jgi:hypothetical protein
MARRRIAWAMDESGKGKRALQDMAKRGQVPGAAKIGGEWTFDVVEFRRWIAEQVEASCRIMPISTRSGARGTSARRSMASASDEAYERLLS